MDEGNMPRDQLTQDDQLEVKAARLAAQNPEAKVRIDTGGGLVGSLQHAPLHSVVGAMMFCASQGS